MVPYEIVSEIIKYFRAYENDEKKEIKLSQKEENICNIITQKYCDIVQKDKDNDNNNTINTNLDNRILLQKLLQGKIKEKDIYSCYNFCFSYSVSDINLINSISNDIEHIYKCIEKLNNITNKGYLEEYKYYIVTLSDKIFNSFAKIITNISNIHYLVSEKRIYLKLIDLCNDLYIIFERDNKKIQNFSVILQYYKDIHLYISDRYITYINNKITVSHIYLKIYTMYINIQDKYNFSIIDHINALQKIYIYYKKHNEKKSHTIMCLIKDIIKFYKHINRNFNICKFYDIQHDIYHLLDRIGAEKIHDNYSIFRDIVPNFSIFKKDIPVYRNTLGNIYQYYNCEYTDAVDDWLVYYIDETKNCILPMDIDINSDYENDFSNYEPSTTKLFDIDFCKPEDLDNIYFLNYELSTTKFVDIDFCKPEDLDNIFFKL